MESKFRIREATPDDVPTLLGLIKELAEFEKLSHAVVATPETLRSALFGKHPAAEAVLGELDREPVAFALYFQNFSTFVGRPGLYLEDLYVRPEHRSQGFGLALLKHLSSIAVERGCGRFEWSVLDWNEGAIQFYKRLGAVPMNEWTVFRLAGDALNRLAGSEP
jgi:GNAT superfamily N-acetyltransferase